MDPKPDAPTPQRTSPETRTASTGITRLGQDQMRAEFIDWIRHTGVADRALKPGNIAAEFVLPDIHGNLVASRDLLVKGPLILTFLPSVLFGSYLTDLTALNAAHFEIREAGATVAAVACDFADSSRDLVRHHFPGLTVLCDLDHGLCLAFGVLSFIPQHLATKWDALNFDSTIPKRTAGRVFSIPATYVIETSGVISAAFIDTDGMAPPSADDIVKHLNRA